MIKINQSTNNNVWYYIKIIYLLSLIGETDSKETINCLFVTQTVCPIFTFTFTAFFEMEAMPLQFPSNHPAKLLRASPAILVIISTFTSIITSLPPHPQLSLCGCWYRATLLIAGHMRWKCIVTAWFITTHHAGAIAQCWPHARYCN